MAYNVVIVDNDDAKISDISTIFRRTPEYTVVSTYHEVKSALGQSSMFKPDLFLINVDNSGNLEALPAFEDLFPDAIVLGTLKQWDSDIAFQVIRSGGLGCLIKPFGLDELKNSIKLFSRGIKGVKPRLFSFFSAKGRSGKTTLIANLALSIAQQTGDLVAIIDAELQFNDMAIFFDIEPTITIVEATRDVRFLSPTKLNSYFLPVTDKIQLLCGPKKLEYSELIDMESLLHVVRMAQTLFHYVLIDLPPGFSQFSTGMCELADNTFMCGMLNTGFEVEHMKRSMSLLKIWEHYGKNVEIIFSRVSDDLKPNIEKRLGHKITAVMPNEFLMVSAANSGKIRDVLDHDSLLSRKINELAKKIIDDR